MGRVVIASIFLALVLNSIASCTGEPGTSEGPCEPDTVESCECSDGSTSERRCDDDGESWGACACSSSDGDGDVDGDTDTDVDSDTDTDVDSDTDTDVDSDTDTDVDSDTDTDVDTDVDSDTDTDVDSDTDTDVDSDTDTDVDSDTDTDVDSDTDTDADADGGPDGGGCWPVGEICLDGQIVRCWPDGTYDVLEDCNVAPYVGCSTGLCETDEDEGPCCVADSDLCSATLDISGEPLHTIDFDGIFDEGYGCTGSYLAFDDWTDFIFRVDSLAPPCEHGFVEVIMRGKVEDFPLGTAVDICGTGRLALRALSVAVNEDIGGGVLAAVTYVADDCTRASGTLTIHSWGTTPGGAFHFDLDAHLHDLMSDAERDVSLSAHGAVIEVVLD